MSFLLDQAERYPPTIKPLLILFTQAAYSILHDFIGPDEKPNHICVTDLRSITHKQFQLLTNLNIWVFVALFVTRNPKHKDTLIESCKHYIGVTSSEIDIATKIMNLDSSEGHILCELLFNGMIDILSATEAIPGGDAQFHVDYFGYDGMFLFPKLNLAYSLATRQYQSELNTL